MSLEVECPSCSKRLIVETVGVVVACPHCGAHLTIPENTPLPLDEVDAAPSRDAGDSGSVIIATPEAAEPNPSDVIDTQSWNDYHSDFKALTDDQTGAQLPWNGEPFPQFDAQADPAWPEFATSEPVAPEPVLPKPVLSESNSDEETNSDSGLHLFSIGRDEASGADSNAAVSDGTEPDHSNRDYTSHAATNSAGKRRGVSPFLFLLVISYASAVTLGFLYLFWQTRFGSPHQLESLPDVRPMTDEQGNIQPFLVPEEAQLPPGHELRLGQSQRFGNVMVTPQRVSRGSLRFVHFAEEAGTDTYSTGRNPPSPIGPVYKLWLKIENVSDDQTITPLGAELVYFRSEETDRNGIYRANNFLCQADEKRRDGKRVLVYDHLTDDVWNLEDQIVNRALAPGESMTTFIPSSPDGIDELEGELVWRVHIRKGYNDHGEGVTTLFEVRFHIDDVAMES